MPVPQSSSQEEPSASWADQMDDLEASEIDPANLPKTMETLQGNTKKVVSYEMEDEKIKKVTRVFRIEKKRFPKPVATRRKWKKFGDAAGDVKGPDPATTKIADDVFLTLTTNIIELEQQDDDPLKKLRDQHKGMVTCRLCKGDHWTSRCPFKDSLGANAMKELEDSAGGPKTDSQPSAAAGGAGLGPPGGGGGKYVPPNQRGGERGKGDMLGSRMNRDDDQCTVRVTNLSEEAQEMDLKELFSHFGLIRRTFLAKDKVTQQSKGFAFVSFASREDAGNAIKNLDGFGYDHLILKVEWAKPSKQP